MDSSLVSIVIPVYNVEPYLEECLNSVIGQTYKNLQIVLVDDGSTDNSGALCDLFAGRDARIEVIHQKNQGLSAVRNTGLAMARGEYLAFVDSDDLLHPEYVEKLYRIMNNENVDIVQCGFKRFQGKAPDMKPAECQDSDIEIVTGREMNRRIYTLGFIDNTVVWAKLYKKRVFEEISFPAGKVNEDTFVTYRLYYGLDKIALTKMPLYAYRYRKNSIMTTKVSMRNLDMLDAFEARMAFYSEKKDEELYYLCLEKYFYSITVLYEKARKRSADKEIVEILYEKAKKKYAQIKENSEHFSKWKLRKYGFFVNTPLIYIEGMRINNFVRRAIQKLQRVVRQKKA